MWPPEFLADIISPSIDPACISCINLFCQCFSVITSTHSPAITIEIIVWLIIVFIIILSFVVLYVLIIIFTVTFDIMIKDGYDGNNSINICTIICSNNRSWILSLLI